MRAPYAAAFKGMATQLEAEGQEVTVNDVAPMTAEDPQGVGLNSALLPLIFGGMASAALLAIQLTSAGQRTLGSVGVDRGWAHHGGHRSTPQQSG